MSQQKSSIGSNSVDLRKESLKSVSCMAFFLGFRLQVIFAHVSILLFWQNLEYNVSPEAEDFVFSSKWQVLYFFADLGSILGSSFDMFALFTSGGGSVFEGTYRWFHAVALLFLL